MKQNIYLLTLNGFGQYVHECGPEAILVIAKDSVQARGLCASADPEHEDAWLNDPEVQGPMSDCLKLGETTRKLREQVLLMGTREGYDDAKTLMQKATQRQ